MKPLDPILAEIAEGARGRPSLYDMAPVAARAAFDARALARPSTRPGDMQVEDLAPDELNGVALRIYRPADASRGATILFLHGGGYMLGGLDQMDGEAVMLAVRLRSVVLSLDYRLAPEHKLPAAFEDAVRALEWARDHIAELGGNADLLCISGESAGANIAASAAIEARDRGIALAGQLLFVPGPDFEAIAKLDENIPYPLLPVSNLRKIAGLALPSAEVAGAFPYSAAHAPSLANLAPAVIAVAGHCPTVEIGTSFAGQLRAAGTEVRFLRFDDMFHPFFAFTAMSPAADRAAGETLDAFGDLLDGKPA